MTSNRTIRCHPFISFMKEEDKHNLLSFSSSKIGAKKQR